MGTDPDRDGEDARAKSVDPATLTHDVVFDALGHPSRRCLCYLLVEEPAWTLSELATRIPALERELGERSDPVGEEQFRIMLAHSHVPALAELGVVAFDDAAEVVSRGEHFEVVSRALEGLSRSLEDGE